MLKKWNLHENYSCFSEFRFVKAEENNMTNNSMREHSIIHWKPARDAIKQVNSKISGQSKFHHIKEKMKLYPCNLPVPSLF